MRDGIGGVSRQLDCILAIITVRLHDRELIGKELANQNVTPEQSMAIFFLNKPITLTTNHSSATKLKI